MNLSTLSVFCDFDGTVTTSDSLILIFDKFCGGNWRLIEDKMLSKEISQRDALREQVRLLKTGVDFEMFLAETVKLRDGFSQFLDFVGKNSIPFMILSGGFIVFIEAILKSHNLAELAKTAEANNIILTENGWELNENNNPKICGNCSNCKTNFVVSEKKKGRTVVYIGDGHTDRCAALQSDIVFARGGLESFLKKKGKSFHHFDSFPEITAILTNCFKF